VSKYTDPKINADGSVDIYFRPGMPGGQEENTVPGKGGSSGTAQRQRRSSASRSDKPRGPESVAGRKPDRPKAMRS